MTADTYWDFLVLVTPLIVVSHLIFRTILLAYIPVLSSLCKKTKAERGESKLLKAILFELQNWNSGSVLEALLSVSPSICVGGWKKQQSKTTKTSPPKILSLNPNP